MASRPALDENRSVAAICPSCGGWVHLCDLGFDKAEENRVYKSAAKVGGTVRFLTTQEVRDRVVPNCNRNCERVRGLKKA